jgi:hypothetical protein
VTNQNQFLCFAGLVVMARSLNPIPFRTRPLNSSAPMVLCLKTRESRSLPGLQSTENKPLRDTNLLSTMSKHTHKTPPRESRRGFAFVVEGEERRESTQTPQARSPVTAGRSPKLLIPKGDNHQAQLPRLEAMTTRVVIGGSGQARPSVSIEPAFSKIS